MNNVEKLVRMGMPVETAKVIAAMAAGVEIGTTSESAMAGNRAPTKTIRGGVYLQQVEDSEATTVAALRDDFNALLSALREAGVLGDE